MMTVPSGSVWLHVPSVAMKIALDVDVTWSVDDSVSIRVSCGWLAWFVS